MKEMRVGRRLLGELVHLQEWQCRRVIKGGGNGREEIGDFGRGKVG